MGKIIIKLIIFISLLLLILFVAIGLVYAGYKAEDSRSVSTIPEIIENYPQECIIEVIPEKNRIAMLDIYITRLEACKTRVLIKELHKKD